MSNPFQALSGPNSNKNIEDAKIVDTSSNESYSEADGSYLDEIRNNHFSSLIELAETIESLISICPEDRLNFRRDFDNFKKLSVLEYEESLKKRLACFEDKEDPEIIIDIKMKISEFDTIELAPLLESICKTLFQPEPKGHGGLFLIGIVVSQRPDLITPKFLSFPHETMIKIAPVVCWIVGHAVSSPTIAHLDPLLSQQLLEIFLPELTNKDKSSNAVAVCAAHLIANAFRQQNIYRASASHFAKLLTLTHSKINSNRDHHIMEVFKNIVPKIDVIDMKDFAPQMMKMFPEAPKFACDLFIYNSTIENGGNASFVDGWIEAHSTYKKASMTYLSYVLGSLPESVVNKFPMEDLIQGDDLSKMAAMKVQLTNSSFRFIFILVLIWILHSVWSKEK